MSARMPFQYVVLRCVPRVDREEFVNVGVVVYCQQAEVLEARCHVDRDRLVALSPDVDVDAVCSALAAVEAVCRGTVVQPGPVHGGTTDDPSAELDHLLDRLVR